MKEKLFSNAIRQFGLCTFWRNNEATRHQMGARSLLLPVQCERDGIVYVVLARGFE